MAAYEKQKQTVWNREIIATFGKENRLVFFDDVPGNKPPLGISELKLDENLKAQIELKEAIDQAKAAAEAKAAAATQETGAEVANTISPFETKDFNGKLSDPAGLENGRIENGHLKFTVAGVERSFKLSPTFKEKLDNTESPEEFKALTYNALLHILSKSNALTTNKFNLKGKTSEINLSNLEMESDVRKHKAKTTPQPAEEAPLETLFESAPAAAPLKAREKAKEARDERLSDLQQYGQNIEVGNTEFGSIGTTGLYTFELGADIKDFDKTYKINNPEVVTLIESREDNKNFHQLSDYHEYESALADLGVPPGQEGAMLNKIVTGDSMFDLNSRLNFNDILEKTGAYKPTDLGLEEINNESSKRSLPLATKFNIEFGTLQKRLNNPKEYKERAQDQARLKELYKIYLASEKILQNLEKDSIAEISKAKAAPLSNNEKAYQNLYRQLRSGEIKDQKGAIENSIVDALTGTEGTYEEVTLDKEKSKFKDDEKGLRKQFSASAMAQHLLDTPQVTIINNAGEEEDLPLFTMKDGEKVYNDKNIIRYFNQLIKLGLEAQSERRDMKADQEAERKTQGVSQQEKDDNEVRFKAEKINPDFNVLTGNLTGRQIQLLRDGYDTELSEDKVKQQQTLEDIILSKEPAIAKKQMELLQAGYPTNKIKEVESKILGAIGAKWKGGDFKGGALVIPLPLGDNFGILLGVTTTPGVNAGFGVTGQIYKGDTVSMSAGATAGLTIDKDGPKAVVTAGWGTAIKIGGPFEFLIGFGVAQNGKEGMAGLTVGLKYNENTDTEIIRKDLNETAGFTEAEEAIAKNATVHELATILRKTEAFKRVPANPKTDYAVVATYKEKYQPYINATAQDKSHPPLHIPITTIGGGVAVDTKGNAGIVLGVELRFGSVSVFKPQTAKAQELANLLGQTEMEDLITNEMSAQALAANKANVISTASTDDLYIDADGHLATLDAKSSGHIEVNEKSLEGYQMKIQNASIVLKEGEPAKDVRELIIENDKLKDLEVYVDPAAKQLGVVFNKPGQHIYLPGNSSDIIIVRENFKYRFDLRKGGPASKDLIIVTTKAEFEKRGYNRDQIINRSSEVIEKKYTDGASTDWDIRRGKASGSKDQITYEKAYHEGKEWKWDNYAETINGVSKAEHESIQATAKDAADSTHEEYEALPEDMGNWAEVSEWLFTQMAGDIRSGHPKINDFPALIAKAKALYSKAYKTELKPEDWNAKMSSQLLTIFQHKYFVNLWEKGDGKVKGIDAIKSSYETNSRYVAENVLAPAFKTKIIELKIKPEAEAGAYALQLARYVQKIESERFNDKINKANLSDPPTLEEINNLITPISEGKLVYSGTYVRATKESLLTGGPSVFQPIAGYPRIGTIGAPKNWNLHAEGPITRDIARIMLENVSPTPTMSPEGIAALRSNPLAKTLIKFPATGYQMGSENFTLVKDFMKNPGQELAAGSPIEKAVQEFIKFAEDVRNASINGRKTVPLSIIEGQTDQVYRTLRLKTGALILFQSPTVESASYGQCGNLSLMAREGMALVTPGSRQIAIIGGSQKVHSGAEISEEKLGFLLGATIFEGDKPKTTPTGSTGSGSETDETAGDGNGGANTEDPVATQHGDTAEAARDYR